MGIQLDKLNNLSPSDLCQDISSQVTSEPVTAVLENREYTKISETEKTKPLIEKQAGIVEKYRLKTAAAVLGTLAVVYAAWTNRAGLASIFGSGLNHENGMCFPNERAAALNGIIHLNPSNELCPINTTTFFNGTTNHTNLLNDKAASLNKTQILDTHSNTTTLNATAPFNQTYTLNDTVASLNKTQTLGTLLNTTKLNGTALLNQTNTLNVTNSLKQTPTLNNHFKELTIFSKKDVTRKDPLSKLPETPGFVTKIGTMISGFLCAIKLGSCPTRQSGTNLPALPSPFPLIENRGLNAHVSETAKTWTKAEKTKMPQYTPEENSLLGNLVEKTLLYFINNHFPNIKSGGI